MIYQPKISIVLPVKNGARFLRQSLLSIVHQTFLDFELVIIDDSSTDRSIEIAQDILRFDGRARILNNPGRGLVDALNFGIRAARAPLVARMDADDIALPHRLELQYKYMSEHPEIDALGTQVIYISEDGVPTGKITTLPQQPEAVQKMLRENCPLRHPTVMLRREAFEAVRGYRRELVAAEDLDLWLRMAERGKLANLAEPLLYYRLHDEQVSRSEKWTQHLSRSLSLLAAEARSQGLADPVQTYRCFSSDGAGHRCKGLDCPAAVCESIKACNTAKAALAGDWSSLTDADVKLLLKHAPGHGLGDGKANRVRVLICIAQIAARRLAPLLAASAIGASLRIHPGRTFSYFFGLRKLIA